MDNGSFQTKSSKMLNNTKKHENFYQMRFSPFAGEMEEEGVRSVFRLRIAFPLEVIRVRLDLQ